MIGVTFLFLLQEESSEEIVQEDILNSRSKREAEAFPDQNIYDLFIDYFGSTVGFAPENPSEVDEILFGNDRFKRSIILDPDNGKELDLTKDRE